MTCEHPRSAKAKRCRACQLTHLNSNPEFRARQKAAVRAHYAKPENLMAAREKMRRINAEILQRPERRQQLREHGRRQAREVLNTPEGRARSEAPEVRARAGAKRSATVLRDIPPSMRDEYRSLTKSGIRAAEAKRIILDQFKTDIARATGK